MKLLDTIHSHDDLIKVPPEDEAQLCAEIREYLVQCVAKNGGHLASNLGIVELTVAIEKEFDTRVDRLVFDVGHQCYVHKLLTGRREELMHMRSYGGIAGFPKPAESDADARGDDVASVIPAVPPIIVAGGASEDRQQHRRQCQPAELEP